MNVGIVTTWFERGAAYVSRQYRNLLVPEIPTYVYARGGEEFAAGDPRWDAPWVTWGARSRIPRNTAIVRDDFLAWVERNAIDTVFFNEQKFWPPVLWCRERGIKTGAYVDYYTESTVPYFGVYDFLVCNTRRHHSVFEWHPQAFYVPWGTELDVFRPQTLEPVEPGTVTFFHSAGMNPARKGCDLVIEAFAQLEGPARLIIHTQVDLKARFPALAPTLDRLLSSGRLRCVQETVPAPGLYHLGDVYVYPSRLEGIGLTMAEAQACGLPTITTDNAPMNEQVDPESGRLVPVSRFVSRDDGYYWPQSLVDAAGIRTAMQWYLDRKDELGALKRRARTWAEAELDWNRHREEMQRIFRETRLRDADEVSSAVTAVETYERKHWDVRHKLAAYPNFYRFLFNNLEKPALFAPVEQGIRLLKRALGKDVV